MPVPKDWTSRFSYKEIIEEFFHDMHRTYYFLFFYGKKLGKLDIVQKQNESYL